MSRLLPPEVRRELDRLRLRPVSALPTAGVGERRSRAVGPGLEFADFRGYQAGDDIRYLDRHVMARLGQKVIRQYSVDKQLQVTFIVDASASMASGEPSKLIRAVELCAALVYVTTLGGDRAKIGIAREDTLKWHPTVTGQRGLGALLAWLEGARGDGSLDLRRLASRSRAIGEASRGGLLVVLSDWFSDESQQAIDSWSQGWSEIVAIQVLAPDEIDVTWLEGEANLVDIENGEVLRVDGDHVDERYRVALAEWQAELGQTVRSRGGGWFTFSSNDSVLSMVNELRRQGLLA